MKVGDLVKERKYPEIGLIVETNFCHPNYGYRVLPLGKLTLAQWDGGWFTQDFMESQCEVVSEGR